MEKIFTIAKVDPVLIYGISDENLKMVENFLDVRLMGRGHEIKIIGEENRVLRAEDALSEMAFIANKNGYLNIEDVETVLYVVTANGGGSPASERELDSLRKSDELKEVVLFTKKGFIKPRSEGQEKIVESIKANDILVVVGPAGTGKTYLAVALAVNALKNKEVSKIVLARPAVEAGESLGYLPGDLKEKIDPYLHPLYDALDEMLPKELLRKYTEQRIIEVIPLAYMRGRTLNNAFIILDEAQNSTSMQMKMCLTRMGINSKAIVNGDTTQIDLPVKSTSGLVEIMNILTDIEGIGFVHLTTQDVVRHRLVRSIIKAYDSQNSQKGEKNGKTK